MPDLILKDIKLDAEAKKKLIDSEKMFTHIGKLLRKAESAGLDVTERKERVKKLENQVVGVLREFG